MTLNNLIKCAVILAFFNLTVSCQNDDTLIPPLQTHASISINEGESVTDTRDILIDLDVPETILVSGYCLSEAPSFVETCESITPPSLGLNKTIAYQFITDDEEEKTIRAVFLDDTNYRFEEAEANIILEYTIIEASGIIINGGDSKTANSELVIKLSASVSDPRKIVAYYLSEEDQAPDASSLDWIEISSADSEYSEILYYTLDELSEGTKTLYVWFKDDAGNISGSASDSITYYDYIIWDTDNWGFNWK